MRFKELTLRKWKWSNQEVREDIIEKKTIGEEIIGRSLTKEPESTKVLGLKWSQEKTHWQYNLPATTAGFASQ